MLFCFNTTLDFLFYIIKVISSKYEIIGICTCIIDDVFMSITYLYNFMKLMCIAGIFQVLYLLKIKLNSLQ